jgi:hypothetical protein
MIGHRTVRRIRRHLDAVDVGQAEVEDHDVGLTEADLLERRTAGGRSRTEVAPRTRGEHAQRLRRRPRSTPSG